MKNIGAEGSLQKSKWEVRRERLHGAFKMLGIAGGVGETRQCNINFKRWIKNIYMHYNLNYVHIHNRCIYVVCTKKWEGNT